MTALIPQEVFLLERYSSVPYLEALRDTWAQMVGHLEDCLDRFMHDMPADYRRRPLPEQPDIVWGERVLPNFRDTLQSLNADLALLRSGDASGLTACNGPLGDFKGQTDFSTDWMAEDDARRYGELLARAVMLASNIQATDDAFWKPGALTTGYRERSRGPLDAPQRWPAYRLDTQTQVASDAPLRISGIYLPDVEDSCAQFLGVRQHVAPQAKVMLQSNAAGGGQHPVTRRDCIWTLVRRVADEGPASAPSLLDTTPARVAGGDTCPHAGFWFTPARAASRRYFALGEPMPTFDSAYGTTFWQWDADQTPHS
ncbi:hypothetical protein IP91_00299 [Pseudoduganella lurida]|uniref:Uncharacterized protein n=1 Tax=Pseudoduganella lurida TaxID=1036180 RepID=A0A562RJX8_9BURK|nr:hypothetical protein [Pseudoduganella lurida]TWI69233.1 hypothetical protein IP91_00299 [Pseudoduganella lurida]